MKAPARASGPLEGPRRVWSQGYGSKAEAGTIALELSDLTFSGATDKSTDHLSVQRTL